MKHNALVSASALHVIKSKRHFTTEFGEILLDYYFEKDILSDDAFCIGFN
jgi:hypothetical protein